MQFSPHGATHLFIGGAFGTCEDTLGSLKDDLSYPTFHRLLSKSADLMKNMYGPFLRGHGRVSHGWATPFEHRFASSGNHRVIPRVPTCVWSCILTLGGQPPCAPPFHSLPCVSMCACPCARQVLGPHDRLSLARRMRRPACGSGCQRRVLLLLPQPYRHLRRQQRQRLLGEQRRLPVRPYGERDAIWLLPALMLPGLAGLTRAEDL